MSDGSTDGYRMSEALCLRRANLVDDLYFDGSTLPATVVLNGWRLRFDTDDEARQVFHMLSLQRDNAMALQERFRRLVQDISNRIYREET